MSDLLSQAEIDALLNGFDGEEGSEGAKPAEAAASEPQAAQPAEASSSVSVSGGQGLSSEEMDVLGEIGNISMGASSTTLSTLINQEVNITTPKVSVLTWEELIKQYPKPYVVAKVEYTEGLIGTNLLIMKVDDIKILTNLMMGGEVQMEDEKLNELQLSAISEAMNQMIGSSCTSMSSMVSKKIDITPPTADYVDFSSEDRTVYKELYGDALIVKISFRMVVGSLIDSEIMQLVPLPFAKEMVKSILTVQGVDTVPQTVQPKETPQPVMEPQPAYEPQPQYASQPQMQQPPMQPQYAPQPQMNYVQEPPRQPVNVQPVQFQSLEEGHYNNYKENIGLIMDVPLQVTVELGRATRMIREILEFGPGSIVELDKLAGEPVDILVNGKVIAKGEVVVIDESFGIRITDIVHPSKRI